MKSYGFQQATRSLPEIYTTEIEMVLKGSVVLNFGVLFDCLMIEDLEIANSSLQN